ncbi:YqgE/AlgH family protein [Methyloraptor flagellatus]
MMGSADIKETGYLDGQILIAMPSMEDQRFSRALIYVCAHSAEGAMGIIINQLAPQMSFGELLVQLDVIPKAEQIQLPPLAKRMRVHHGGPVESGRGFVLHSSDYFIENATLPIDRQVSLTTTLEVLKAIAEGRGPENAILALGYAGWAPGQLENEIQWNGWLNCPADPSLLFDPDLDSKYDRAMRSLGIEIGLLSRDAGHA